MKRLLFFSLSICIAFLTSCSKEQSFENFFHTSMDEMHKVEENYSYSLIHTEMNVMHEDDAITIFKESNQQDDHIFIAYFEKENNKWNWKQTRGTDWNSPHKWSSMNQVPYIYSGAISDESISKVYAGTTPAKIIIVKDAKRFWYAISDVKDVDVKVVKKDGTKEIIEEIDKQFLKDWNK